MPKRRLRALSAASLATLPLRIAIVHPNLGIGGAERLIVDAAVGLQARGHDVVVYTSAHDPKHCFPETVDGTLKVAVHGAWLPHTILGGLAVVCAWLRALWVCATLALRRRHDVYLVDQVSAGIPLLKLAGARVVFYCHFPDQLLAQHTSALRRAYRYPFDALEQWTTAKADEIMVNSAYTRDVFQQTFPRIRTVPAVVYPGVATDPLPAPALPAWVPRPFYLSLNRFEQKKGIEVAVRAFARAEDRDTAHLIVAGGYDPNLPENKRVLESLQQLCDELGLTHATVGTVPGAGAPPQAAKRVVFCPSVSQELKNALLAHATALAYTPQWEHFGIVPLEAMRAGTPVIAVANGGPAETVVHGECGYLCDPADLVSEFVRGLHWARTADRAKVTRAGQKRARDFGLPAFLDGVESAVLAANAGQRMEMRARHSAKKK